MIINWIALHNFMSYADARLDLSSVGLACLSGENGAGKSALLDAVSWALWEAARAPSDELIRLGETQMWVDVCVTSDGRTYRIRRARQKSYGRSGQRLGSRGSLEVQVFNGTGDEWRRSFVNQSGRSAQVCGDHGDASSVAVKERSEHDDDGSCWTSLTAATMRETQERLRQLLHMDYDAFATSVYLRQGRSDEFTVRTPAERKQVLSEILGLGYYDQMQEIAREEQRQLKAKVQLLEASTTSGKEVENSLSESYDQLSCARHQLESNQNELIRLADSIDGIENEMSAIRLAQVRIESLERRRQELRLDVARLTEQEVETSGRLRANAAIIDRGEKIECDFEAYQTIRNAVEQFETQSLRYHELSVKRLELRSALATERGRLEVEIEHLRADLEAQNAKRKKLSRTEHELATAESDWQSYRSLLNEEAVMLKRKEDFAALTMRQEELQLKLREARVRLEAEIQQKTMLLEELNALDKAGDTLEQEKAELDKLSEEMDRLEAEFERVEELGLKTKSEIDGCEQQIKQIQRHLRENHERAGELETASNLSRCPLCRASIVDRAAVLERYQQDAAQSENEIATLEERRAELEETRARLRREYVELRHRLDERKSLDVRIGEFNAKKSALSRSKQTRDILETELAAANSRLTDHNYAFVERESLVRIRAELSTLDFDPVIFTSLQAQIRAQRHVEFRWQQLQRDAAELKTIDEAIPRAESKIADLSKRLQTDAFAPELRVQFEQVERELTECQYDRQAHQDAKKALSTLIEAPENMSRLKRAREEEVQLSKAHSEICAARQSRNSDLAQTDADLAAASGQVERLVQLEGELSAALAERSERQNESRLAERSIAGLEERLAQLELGKSDLDSKRAALAEAVGELGEYSQLVEILGKKGIQAVIIENAIPEIETEANRILGRLSDNQMHVALVTQQRNRQGGAVETLEIVIADQLGTRAYELYSGGEAFKINLALRLSIAKLLARRSGARLETLILDEGFGSQDEASRMRLVRAIDSIKGDFARILVVTHISEVQDMFPVQIVVTKDSGVSQVRISH